MSLGTILVIVLVLIIVSSMPGFGYPHTYGYYPTGLGGVLLLVVLILLLTGRL